MCASCLFYIYLFSLSLSLRVCALVCPACLPVYSSARALSMHVLVHSLSLTLINSIHPSPSLLPNLDGFVLLGLVELTLTGRGWGRGERIHFR